MPNVPSSNPAFEHRTKWKFVNDLPGNIKGGKYHYTIDLLFDWFGLVCFANKNQNCQLSYSWFQTSGTGDQWYSDTSHFSIPWICFSFQKPAAVAHLVEHSPFDKNIEGLNYKDRSRHI